MTWVKPVLDRYKYHMVGGGRVNNKVQKRSSKIIDYALKMGVTCVSS